MVRSDAPRAMVPRWPLARAEITRTECRACRAQWYVFEYMVHIVSLAAPIVIAVALTPTVHPAVQCWGRNNNGQLGLGDDLDRGDTPASLGANLPAVALGAGDVPVGVYCGSYFTCVLLDDGAIKVGLASPVSVTVACF